MGQCFYNRNYHCLGKYPPYGHLGPLEQSSIVPAVQLRQLRAVVRKSPKVPEIRGQKEQSKITQFLTRKTLNSTTLHHREP